MYQVTRSEKEIDSLLNQCLDAQDSGESKYPGMSYEQGIRAAIEWITGQDENPLS